VRASTVEFDGAIADGQTIECASFQKRSGFGSALDFGEQAAFDVQATRVFGNAVPDTDGLGWVVLPKQFYRRRTARKAGGERTAGNNVAASVRLAEDGGVAFEGSG